MNRNMPDILKSSLVFILIVFFQQQAHAGEYYVAPNGSDANPGTLEAPWQSLTRANQVLVAGDTVYLKAGTYSTYIAPANSGAAGNPITYTRYGEDAVTIVDAAYGILLDGKSFITVQNINFYNLDKFLWLQNSANHNTIAYCSFDKGRTIGWSGSKIYRNSSYNKVHNCTFSHYGYYTNDDIGSVLDIGNENDKTDLSYYNLIENNTMYHGGHHVIGIFGKYNIVRNNYFHNEIWDSGYGGRVVYLNGYPENSGRNLIEGNRIAYSAHPPDNWGAAGMSLDNSHNIIRGNFFYHNDLAGLSVTTSPGFVTSPTYNKVYHNTFFHNGMNTDPNAGQELLAGIGFANYGGPGPVIGNAIKNNILRSNPKAYGTYNSSLSDQVFAGNWEEFGDPLFVNADIIPGDPMNKELPDLRIASDSPCTEAGTFLTRIVSESGCGTTFKVEDAGYFMDGWGIVEGDVVQVLGTSQTARVANADYEAKTITVDTVLVWNKDDGLSLAYEGNAPDIGAYENIVTSAVFTVTASAGENGSICPDTPQAVKEGQRAKLAIIGNWGYEPAIDGTCTGTFDGKVFTTDPVSADCMVFVLFSQITYTVTPSAGPNGSISPDTPQKVNYGLPTTFTITPDSGYTPIIGGTCGGTLEGTLYTTDPVFADCSVTVIFSQKKYLVTPSAGLNGSISPKTPQEVFEGARTSFTIIPNSGYEPTISGTCGGTFDGTVYTTNPVYADCTVTVVFSRIKHTVTPWAGAYGSISPNTPQEVIEGNRIKFTVKPNRRYRAVMSGTCGGYLYGNTYTTNRIYNDCTVIARFVRR